MKEALEHDKASFTNFSGTICLFQIQLSCEHKSGENIEDYTFNQLYDEYYDEYGVKHPGN